MTNSHFRISKTLMNTYGAIYGSALENPEKYDVGVLHKARVKCLERWRDLPFQTDFSEDLGILSESKKLQSIGLVAHTDFLIARPHIRFADKNMMAVWRLSI
jgi:hypothetical protein